MTPRADARAAEAAARGVDSELEALARLHGVQSSYTTAVGHTRRADPDAVLAVLRTLGVPLEDHGDVGTALRAARAERGRALLPPVAVVWRGSGGTVRLHVLEDEAEDSLRCRLVTQGGDTMQWDGDLHASGSDVVQGDSVIDARLRLPPDLPLGYHDLDVMVGGREARCRVIVAPPRAWTPEGGGGRGWGAFLPLYALRTERSWGTADLTDLEALEGWIGGLGGEMVGTLPILAAFLDEPFEPSPYAPVSRLFWNELYLDPERVPGWERAEGARRLLASEDVRATLERLRRARDVDYREAARVKRRVLEELASAFAPPEEPLPPELAIFAEERPEALRYARFRAVCERRESGWRAWPAAQRDGTLAPGDYDERAVRYHLFAQWAMGEALEGLSRRHAGLYLDLPLGTHADGFDVWRFRDLFAEDVSAGAPPDAFFAGGQDWGIPPLHPGRLRDAQHAYWAASLRRLMSASAMLRLDHVMALHRLYWVPRGFPATEGVYVRYPAEELYAVLSLESHRHECELVGEDLGTVPDEVVEAMDRHGLRRMYVVPFETEDGEEKPPRLRPPPPSAVASVGTHDMAPWAGFWEAADVRLRVEDGQLDPDRAAEEREERERWRRRLLEALEAEGEAADPYPASKRGGPAEAAEAARGHGGRGEHRPSHAASDAGAEASGAETAASGAGAEADGARETAGDAHAVEPTAALRPVLRFLARSPARLVLVSLEDLWGETRPQNRPGTAGGDNWRRKASRSLEEMRRMPEVVAPLEEVDALRRAAAGTSDDE